MIGFLSYVYYTNLSSTIRQESQAYLRELSGRISNDVGRIIDDNIAVLYTMAASIEESDKTSLAELKPMLTKQKEYFNFKEIYLVDADGKAYGLDSSVFISLDGSVRTEVLGGKPTMSTTQVINNQEYILFSVPLEGYSLGDTKMIALMGCYDPSSFNDILSMVSFNEMAYSQIITQNGTAVTRPTSPYALQGGYNILATLKESATLEDGYSIEKLQTELNLNGENQLVFSMEGTKWYLVYTPIAQNNWYLFTYVPVEAVNQKSDTFLQATLVVCGLITLLFSAMVAALVYVFNKHKLHLEKLVYVDSVTGGNTMPYFYQKSEEIFLKNEEKQYALLYINVEKFKVMNEQLGRATCDNVLRFLNTFFCSQLREDECIGRQFADNFCILIEYKDERALALRLQKWCIAADKYAVEQKITWGLPTLQMGVYVIQNKEMSFEQMIDRAKLAVKETTWAVENKLRYGFYDDEVRQKLFREKQLEDRMVVALAEGEFKVYLQPKFSLPSETIGGAEALVRWESPNEGMIFPGEFIPLFEKNGFIVPLDLWVFEEVCRAQQRWKNMGYEPVKVSVNCSRLHLKDPGFLQTYINIANRYHVEKWLLEIELTESVVMENSERLTQVIASIREAGFGCSMDDFGSGYSSLNMLQSIPVDTLKLDKIFFSQNDEPQRTEALVKSIVAMASALHMETVAEGVEVREQVEMLKRTGCHYIQGYVFARPMKLRDFEALAFTAEEEEV